MNDMPLVSIILPVWAINDYVRESMPHIRNRDYTNFEVLIFPDVGFDEVFDETRIIPTGKMVPAEKRDLALKYAKGEIFAFLDDDAYPEHDWLTLVVGDFSEKDVGAVGESAVTLEDDGVLQKSSDLCLKH